MAIDKKLIDQLLTDYKNSDVARKVFLLAAGFELPEPHGKCGSGSVG